MEADPAPAHRQFIAVKFRSDDERQYTYHNDGEPVGAGQEVKLPARTRKGEIPDPDEWVRGIVVEINVEPPTAFATKGILGLAPLKDEERRDLVDEARTLKNSADLS